MAPMLSDGEAHLEELQRNLKAKKAACEQLTEEISAVRAERDAAKTACLAGVNAAKVQMARMAAELRALNSRAQCAKTINLQEDESAGEKEPGDAEGLTLPIGDEETQTHVEASAESAKQPEAAAAPKPATEEERSRLEELRLEARLLRHELSKWRHQAESLESEQSGQEREIAYLKAQLAHARDVLDSTRHAVRHHEVERKLREVSLLPLPDSQGGLDARADLRLWQGGDLSKLALQSGKGSIEAKAERIIRERTEDRAGVLSVKAQRLMSVVSSQQLLIQRLEKQILKDEDALEQREWQLASASKQHARLKGALRQRSDGLVAAAVGVPGTRKQASSVPPGRCSDAGTGSSRGPAKSSSVSQLPLIEDRP